MRKILTLAALVAGIATCASARNRNRTTDPAFRIDLTNRSGAVVLLANDQPVTRGSVVMFHRHPDGRYTSVPVEEVAAIRPISQQTVARRRLGPAGVATANGDGVARPLAPGDAIVIGATGDGSAAVTAAAAGGNAAPSPSAGVPANASATAGIQNQQAVESVVFPGDLPAPGAGASGNALSSPVYGGSPTGTQPVMGGSAAAAANPVGPNGFPTATTSAPINPNGFPATTTGPQSGTNPIDPNGFPATTTTGPQPGAAQPIGPNGFPTTTTSPNTTTAPNGTPASAAPNGTAPAQGQTAVPAKGSTVNAGSGHK